MFHNFKSENELNTSTNVHSEKKVIPATRNLRTNSQLCIVKL